MHCAGRSMDAGQSFPPVSAKKGWIAAHIRRSDALPPALLVSHGQYRLMQVAEQTARIEAKTTALACIAATSEADENSAEIPKNSTCGAESHCTFCG
jgi:hypothetical protein